MDRRHKFRESITDVVCVVVAATGIFLATKGEQKVIPNKIAPATNSERSADSIIYMPIKTINQGFIGPVQEESTVRSVRDLMTDGFPRWNVYRDLRLGYVSPDSLPFPIATPDGTTSRQ